MVGVNKAKNWNEFETALRMEAVPMFNTLTPTAKTIFLCNPAGKFRSRNPSLDWKQPVDGGASAYKWTKLLPFERKPALLNPQTAGLYTKHQITVRFLPVVMPANGKAIL